MTKMKLTVLSALVTGGALFGGGCVNADRLFNGFDFLIALVVTALGGNLLGGIVT